MAETFLNYIAGQWAECKSKKTFPNVNPANTDEVVGLFQASGPEDVRAAFDAAVLKPASLAPLSAYRLVEALHEAGVPAGAVNYLTGGGGSVGNAILEHSALRAVSFTGSCEVGNKLHEKMNGRKVRIQLEMGGKNPTVVLKDADLDYAADILVNGSFFSTGQKCTACSRAVIEKAVYEPLVEKLV